MGSTAASKQMYASGVISQRSSIVGDRSSMSDAIIAAPCVDKPGISAVVLSTRIKPTQNDGPGRQRMNPVNTGSPQYNAYRPHSML